MCEGRHRVVGIVVKALVDVDASREVAIATAQTTERCKIQNHKLQDVSSKSYDRWSYMPEREFKARFDLVHAAMPRQGSRSEPTNKLFDPTHAKFDRPLRLRDRECRHVCTSCPVTEGIPDMGEKLFQKISLPWRNERILLRD